ncbi:MAG: hypothetical protein J2P46_21830 [Zavarzinella sp.]|nr:hypothetical protein [Zavarzinella sp.]
MSLRLMSLGLCALAAGCAGYRSRELVVAVRDAETHRPVPAAAVTLSMPHTGADGVKGAAGADGVARVGFTPADGEPVLIEAAATGYLHGSSVVGPAAVVAVPPAPVFGATPPRAPDFTVDLYAGPRFAIELVVPPGYRGLVRAEFSFRDDLPVPPGQRTFAFEVSPSGQAAGTGPGVLRTVPPAEYRVRTADGTPVGGAGPDDVALRWLRREGGADVFVLGTEADLSRYRRELAPDPGTASPADKGKRGGRGGGGRRRGG